MLHRRIDDRDFSLDGYEPLKAIYADDHPYQVIMKPAQVGLSEWAITCALHALDVGAKYWNTHSSGLNVGYLFPTKDALSDFSKERISGLKSETEYLQKFFTDFDDLGFKQVRHSYFYLRGAWSTRALKSFKADLLIFDELDEMIRSAIALAKKRLRHSEIKRQMYLSTPTFPGTGIHAMYLESDQHVWQVCCQKCKAWNELDFFRDARVAGEAYEEWQVWTAEKISSSVITIACPSCHKALTDEERLGPGRWVALHPEITRVRGRAIPPLSFRSVSLKELCLAAIKEDADEVQEFYRSDLGLPYEPGGSRITDEMMKKLSYTLEGGLLPRNIEWRDTCMGVDVGKRLHYRIGSTDPKTNERYVRAMGFVRDWNELDTLWDQYKIRNCVIDALPELHACSAWAAKHEGKVLRAFYPNTRALQGKLFRTTDADNPDIESGTVQVNRTEAMDTVYNMIAAGREHWPAAIHNETDIIAQMKAPVRVVTEDEHGQPHAAWVHTSPDHYFHACVYELIANRQLPQGLEITSLRLR